MHAESNSCDSGNREQAGVSEDNPQPDPARGTSQVNRIPHVAVEADNDQPLWRGEWRRSPVPSPAKIPNATQGDCESNDRREGGYPTPMGCAGQFDLELMLVAQSRLSWA